MRALATGDNHLGAGADLGRIPGERLAEQEQVWRRTLELAREYECDVVLHGGDLFHRASPSPEEVLAALRPLVEHGEAGGCPVVMALGNHERRGVSEATMPAAIAELDALHVSHSPEVVLEVDGYAICTLPWTPTSRLVAADGGGDRDDVNAHAAELLLAAARGLHDQADGRAILLTHFSISGSSLPNGLPVDQLREPVLELADLEALGFEAVVAGHIHKGQIMGRDDVPVFYVGSPMPLSFGETGYDHGCYILESSGLHGLLSPRFVPIESRPLRKIALSALELEVPAGGGPNFVDWEEHDVAGAIVKVTIHATAEQARGLDLAAFKREVYEQGAHKIASVQLEVERQERERVEGLSEELGEMEALSLWLAANGINGARETELRARTERYLAVAR